MNRSSRRNPVVVHILDQLHVGGMETVAVNFIERTARRYDHCVICLSAQGPMADRLDALGIPARFLGKKPGKDLMAYVRLRKMLHKMRPDIVHTYNIGAIDTALCARLAGVRHVVHAEHGRDASDPHGRNRKYRWLRRLLSPAINVFVAVSEDLSEWLARDIGIPRNKVRLIYNGVDTEQYRPGNREAAILPAGFAPPGSAIIGSVGRLDPVKAYDVLLQAFARVCESAPAPGPRLILVGDGPERVALEARAQELGVASRVWFAGARDDVPRLLPALDVYVCSSIAEGIALTIIEAMASGLPVIATRVGGNPELVVPEQTGSLVPASDPDALAQALELSLAQPELLRAQGSAGRKRAQTHFSIDAMIAGYCTVYDALSGTAPAAVETG